MSDDATLGMLFVQAAVKEHGLARVLEWLGPDARVLIKSEVDGRWIETSYKPAKETD